MAGIVSRIVRFPVKCSCLQGKILIFFSGISGMAIRVCKASY